MRATAESDRHRYRYPPDDEEEKTVEIVLSPAEVVFLRSVTRHSQSAADRSPQTGTLRRKLEGVAVGSGTWGNARIVVDVNEAELSSLQQITQEIYCFITEEERRARLVLREKLLVSAQRLCAKLTARSAELATGSHALK